VPHAPPISSSLIWWRR